MSTIGFPGNEGASRRAPILNIVGCGELLRMELPPREHMLVPWLCRCSVNMVHAWRGVGKTHFSLGLAYAVATGGTFLGWTVPKPRTVLYLDGEMGAVPLQERIKSLTAAAENHEQLEKNLRFYTPDLQNAGGILDLSDVIWHPRLEEAIGDAELIIVDNISCLSRTAGRENEAESWWPLQEWALAQKLKKRTVLFIHHSNKNGKQRGTSKREDMLDTVINLSLPEDYKPEQGARFTVIYEKARGFHGDSARSFTAHLHTVDGLSDWEVTPVAKVTPGDEVHRLMEEGLSAKAIAAQTGLSPATVYRYLQRSNVES